MKTIKFFNMFVEKIDNDIISRSAISNEFTIDLPEDFDLDYAFDMLSEKIGQTIDAFSYEVLTTISV